MIQFRISEIPNDKKERFFYLWNKMTSAKNDDHLELYRGCRVILLKEYKNYLIEETILSKILNFVKNLTLR